MAIHLERNSYAIESSRLRAAVLLVFGFDGRPAAACEDKGAHLKSSSDDELVFETCRHCSWRTSFSPAAAGRPSIQTPAARLPRRRELSIA